MCSPRIAARVASLFAALFLGATLSAHATAQQPQRTWLTQIDLGLNSASGNSSLTTLLAGISLRRLETETIEFEISTNYRTGRSEGRTITDLFQAALKFDIAPQATWSPFLYASAERNPVRRLSVRANGGAGGKYTFWRTARGKASVSMASILNYEDFESAGGIGVPIDKDSALEWASQTQHLLRRGCGVRAHHVLPAGLGQTGRPLLHPGQLAQGPRRH